MSSGFLKFPSKEQRDEFLNAVATDQPELLPKLTSSQLRPEIIAENLVSAELEEIKRRLAPDGQWFGDASFESFG